MADAGTSRPLQGWQRANVVTAANYLRDLLTRVPNNVRLRAVHDGLVEALDPARRVLRLQREAADAAAAAKTTVRVEKRSGGDRRSGVDRRVVNLGTPGGTERRVGERRKGERRSSVDRRHR